MTVDLVRITQLLTDALLRDLGAEVDLIFRYGSQVKGTTHAYSDLDLSYVPAHESTRHSITILVGEMLCDLYPIPWSRLESMADFENVSSTVLLDYQLIYQRSDEVAHRMRALADRLRSFQQPAARPAMLKKAQKLFQQVGYPYYLLRQQSANGHVLASLQHAQQVLSTVLHCLAVCNQACIDTRKREQVLALPTLPADFAETLERLTDAHEPAAVLAATDRLLQTTRDLLLAEQHQHAGPPLTFAAAFGPGYPELKGDLQHILLACERRDPFALRGPLVSLYHELSLALARVYTGIDNTSFNSLAEYEQDLVALGFPALLPSVEAMDFSELHRQCLAFDQHLQQFLTDHSVNLYTYATVDELQHALGMEHRSGHQIAGHRS